MNKKPYSHITKTERLEIALLLRKGYSYRDMSAVLGRSHTSISREVTQNKVNGAYDPKKAHTKAQVRRKQSKYQGMKVRERPGLECYVQKKMKGGWTPGSIAGRLQEIDTHLPYVSKDGIYKYLYSVWGQYYCQYLPSQRYKRRKRRGKKTKWTMIPNRVGIEQRSEEIEKRSCFGHFEGDTVVSGRRHRSNASLSVLYERKARYIDAKKIPDRKPESNNGAIASMAEKLTKFLSLTLDNGIENTKHEELQELLAILIYFCDPYASWQKGGVEQSNGLLRRFIPKGANIDDYTQEEIDMITMQLNNTPRKCLGYKTPMEVMQENNLLSPNYKTSIGWCT